MRRFRGRKLSWADDAVAVQVEIGEGGRVGGASHRRALSRAGRHALGAGSVELLLGDYAVGVLIEGAEVHRAAGWNLRDDRARGA